MAEYCIDHDFKLLVVINSVTQVSRCAFNYQNISVLNIETF